MLDREAVAVVLAAEWVPLVKADRALREVKARVEEQEALQQGAEVGRRVAAVDELGELLAALGREQLVELEHLSNGGQRGRVWRLARRGALRQVKRVVQVVPQMDKPLHAAAVVRQRELSEGPARTGGARVTCAVLALRAIGRQRCTLLGTVNTVESREATRACRTTPMAAIGPYAQHHDTPGTRAGSPRPSAGAGRHIRSGVLLETATMHHHDDAKAAEAAAAGVVEVALRQHELDDGDEGL